MTLVACAFVNFHCKQCGWFTLRLPISEKHVRTECLHCGRRAEALFASTGWTSQPLPSSTDCMRFEGGNPGNYVNMTSWQRKDGSRMRPKPRYGVARA